MAYKAANNSSIYNIYESNIQTVLDSEKLDFLNNTNINSIFGVSIFFGELYCKQILSEFPEFAESISKGDYKEHIFRFITIGNQETFFSEELNTIITASTSRYIYHSLLINKYIDKNFNSKIIDIVEIGGGYGGLCYWLRVINLHIDMYTIIDLPLACKLQERCLDILNTSYNTVSNVNEYSKSSRPLFAISNYGYSELEGYYQNLYKNTILKLADGGFMIWNNWSGIYKFTDLKLTIEDERPTFSDCYNKFIYF